MFNIFSFIIFLYKICNYFTHTNEWITSLILLEFLHEYSDAIQNNSTILGFSATLLFESVSIYIMPIVNPDGVGFKIIGNFY